jgi:hypothetical protein
MKKGLVLVLWLALFPPALASQGKSVLVVHEFTVASGVNLPYDMKLMHPQLVSEFKVMLAKDFEIVAEAPAAPAGRVYALNAEITAWRPGNAAKRLLVGMGSGREASDIQYRVVDASGNKVVDSLDTIRTNFYSQGAGSTGTLAHPIAQKIADRIKDAKLK